MLPESNVSVPATVVILTRSRVPGRDTDPAPVPTPVVLERAITEFAHQTDPVRLTMETCPCLTSVATLWLLGAIPVVKFADALVVVKADAAPR